MATYQTPSGATVDDTGKLLSGPTGAASGSSSGGSTTATDPFISELQNRLLQSSGMVSSTDSKIESSINAAIQGVKAGNEASKAATESSYNRQEADVRTQGAQAITSAEEAQRGFATNTAALKQLSDYTDKSVKDLEQRKQEALLSGDATTASKIADMQLQKLQFEQDAQQRTFTNLLSLGSFAIQSSQEKRAAQAQSFQESQAISTIALKYGLTVKPGDTIDTITARAMPFASQEEQLQIQQTKANIAKLNAETQKAMQEGKATDPIIIDALARAAAAGQTGFLANIKDNATAAAVYSKMEELTKPRQWTADELSQEAIDTKAQGVSYTDAKAAIATDARIINKEDAYAALDSVYGKAKDTGTYAFTLPDNVHPNNQQEVGDYFSKIFAGLK